MKPYWETIRSMQQRVEKCFLSSHINQQTSTLIKTRPCRNKSLLFAHCWHAEKKNVPQCSAPVGKSKSLQEQQQKELGRRVHEGQRRRLRTGALGLTRHCHGDNLWCRYGVNDSELSPGRSESRLGEKWMGRRERAVLKLQEEDQIVVRCLLSDSTTAGYRTGSALQKSKTKQRLKNWSSVLHFARSLVKVSPVPCRAVGLGCVPIYCPAGEFSDYTGTSQPQRTFARKERKALDLSDCISDAVAGSVVCQTNTQLTLSGLWSRWHLRNLPLWSR